MTYKGLKLIREFVILFIENTHITLNGKKDARYHGLVRAFDIKSLRLWKKKK